MVDAETIVEIFRDVHQSALFQWTGWVFGFVGVVLALALFFLARKEKRPFWIIDSRNLIHGFTKTVPKLAIKYQGEDVENVTVSKIVFWNNGRETIHGSDIAEADPLRIVPVNGCRLLDVQILKVNKRPSQFLISCKPDMAEAYLTFDFLDKGWGAVIQVIHTGLKSQDLSLVGTIKGSKAPKLKHRAMKSRRALARENSGILLGLVGAIVLLGVSAYLTGKDSRSALLSMSAILAGFLFALGFLRPKLPAELAEDAER